MIDNSRELSCSTSAAGCYYRNQKRQAMPREQQTQTADLPEMPVYARYREGSTPAGRSRFPEMAGKIISGGYEI